MQNKLLKILCLGIFITFALNTANVGLLAQNLSPGAPPSGNIQSQVAGDIYGQVGVIGDVDGDGSKDVIFGSTDGKIHIFSSSTGKEIVRPPYWPKQTGGPILSDIKVTSLDGNEMSIIVTSQNGKVYCLDGMGREKWIVDTRGRIMSAGAEVADIEGNGSYDVLVGNDEGKVFRISPSGQVVWEIESTGPITGTIVARDIAGDGKKDIIFKDNQGKVTMVNDAGNVRKGWPKLVTGNREWAFEVDAVDLDGDGVKEIFTTTPDGQLIIWNPDGTQNKTLSIGTGSHGAPMVADLNNDGTDEFVIGHYDGKVSVYDFNGKLKPGFPFSQGSHSIFGAPVILDIDGDGEPDIIYTASNPGAEGLQAGYVMAINSKGQPLKGYPKYVGKVVARPTFADLNGNGKLELIVVGGIGYTGKQLNVFETEARVRVKIAVVHQEINYK